MSDLYKDPILSKYFELILSNTGDTFKEQYYGDPVRVPASNLPALIISKVSTKIEHLSNVQDQHSIEIVLTVITDIRADLSDYTNIVAGINTLYNLIEGRNADYTLKSSSILGILRDNLEVDLANNLRTDLKTITVADYGMSINKRTADGWAMESQIKFTAYFVQNRLNINP